MENRLFLIFEILLVQWQLILLTGSLCFFIWYLFIRPFNLFMDISELGFDSISNLKGKNSHMKRVLVNELRERKKIGDLPPSYPNGWFAILETDELPLKSVKEVYSLGKNLVAWRGRSGQAYVADAYCPHLGAHLGVGGKVVNEECIQCPFHSWSFNGTTGYIDDIPYTKSKCLETSELARLKMWPVVERYGFIFIWFHADGFEPQWTLPDIPEVESGRWKYRGRSEFRVSCHAQEIPENGADVAHLSAVHTTPAIRLGMDLDQEWNVVKHIWNASWSARDEPGRKHEAVATVEHHLSFFNDSFRLFSVIVKAQQIGPGVVLMYFDTVLGRGVLLQTVTPVEPLLQRVIHRFYSAPSLIHPVGIAILYTEAVQISRDIRIWNRKTFLRRPILVKEDLLINKFRRWYAQFYSAGSLEIKVKDCIRNGNYQHGKEKLIDIFDF